MECDNLDAANLSPDFEDMTLDSLYGNLQDSRVTHIYNPYDEICQKRSVLHTLMSEEKSQMDRKTQNEAAQNTRSDRSTIEGSSQASHQVPKSKLAQGLQI